MDLVGYSQERFDEIVADYTAFAEGIGLKNFLPVPISGLKGDNITLRSDNTPWYNGPVLLDHLETVELDTERLAQRPFRMAVQWVNRPNLDFRGFSGLIGSGTVKPGDAIRVLPSGQTSTIKSIVNFNRSEERRVGEECVRPGRYRWSKYH